MIILVFTSGVHNFAFSMQSMCVHDSVCEMYIEVNGQRYGGFHLNTEDTAGDSVSSTVISQCNIGNAVLVKAGSTGANIYGTYQNMPVSTFTGTLVALL